MTQEELDEINARCDKATRGPWRWEVGILEGRMTAPYPEGVMTHAAGQYVVFVPKRAVFSEDMEFIAHARDDVEALVDEVARLQEFKCVVEYAEKTHPSMWLASFSRLYEGVRDSMLAKQGLVTGKKED